MVRCIDDIWILHIRNMVRPAAIPECHCGITLESAELRAFHRRPLEGLRELRLLHSKNLEGNGSRIVGRENRARTELGELCVAGKPLVPRADVLAYVASINQGSELL